MTTAAPAQPLPPRPAVMGPYRPDWMEKPSGDDLAAFYPTHAARNNISGKATIVCKVMPEGRLDACQVTSETPIGEGFGEAALKLSAKFRMIPPDDPMATPKTVTVPLVFQVPKSAPLFSLPGGAFRMGLINEDVPEAQQGSTHTASPHHVSERAAIWPPLAIAGVSVVLLVVMFALLGRYNTRAAARSAARKP